VEGAAPLQTTIVYGDGQTVRYDIGLNIIEEASLIVYVDKVEQSIDTTGSSGYQIDYFNKQILFASAPLVNSVIEIIALGIGGVAILDFQRFVADGETRFYLTKAQFDQTDNIFVTIDGQQVEAGFVKNINRIRNSTCFIANYRSGGFFRYYRHRFRTIEFGEGQQTFDRIRRFE
jgi:hypothetical protein